MNIINAIINLVNKPITELYQHNYNRNRANGMGDSLEEYVKDLFADTFNYKNEMERLIKIQEVFSYLGNNSNPPDGMLWEGDAIEIKKIEKNNSYLALNSSYPKQKLYANSEMISLACKNAENWTVKDLIYIVGVVLDNKLKHLCFVYGLDYAASEDTYIRVKKTIKSGVESILGVEFADTKELGRVNRIDPLGITYLRVRGMWGIENPWTVFDYAYTRDLSKEFNFMCIINDEKWNTLPNTSDLESLIGLVEGLAIVKIKIKNPDNPAQLRNARLITFSK